eukprot:Gb_22462 [translate_table: standard]
MQQFSTSSLDITAILSLYPSIKIPKITNAASPGNVFESSFDTLSEKHLTKTLSDASDEVEAGFLSASQVASTEDEEKGKSLSWKLNHNALTALIKYLFKKRKVIIGKAAAEDTDEVVAAVVEDASTSVDVWRSRSSMKVRD